MATVDLPHGTLHYHQAGGGPPIVFLHGYLMGASLWDPVVQLLAGEFRCLTPELPFGAHPTPLRPDADLSTAGVGRLVADFLAALGLRQVLLVGNDSGGAIAQLVAARHPRRLGGLVLATCDAFDNHPPGLFRPLITAARTGVLAPLLATLKVRPVRSLPSAYGWLSHHRPPHELIDRWLAGILPDARLELIEGSRTWVMRDQPQRTAQLIGHFARQTASTQPT